MTIQMTCLWNRVSNLLGVIGFVLIFLGVSTSDYHVMEMGQTEPTHVWWMIVIGVAMLLPFTLRAIKGGR